MDESDCDVGRQWPSWLVLDETADACPELVLCGL